MEFRFAPFLISAIVGVMLFATLLVPVVGDISKTVGESESIDNVVRGGYTYNEWKGEDVTFSVTRNPTVYSVDGTAVTLIASPQQVLIASNFFSLRTGGTADTPDINLQYQGLTAGNGKTFTFEISNGDYTLTISPGLSDETVLTGKLDWMFYAVPAAQTGNSGLGQITAPTSSFYTSDINDIVVLGNIYTTGDNDTYYAYYNGELTVNEEYQADSSVDITKTVKSGYTNIYNTAVTVNIGEESFTPFFILAPISVSGNADDEMTSLVGIIPVLVLAGLIIGIVAVLGRRAEWF